MARILFALPRFHTNLWFAIRQIVKDGHTVALFVNQAAGLEDHSTVEPQVMGRYPSAKDVGAKFRSFAPDIVFVRNAWGVSRSVAQVARKEHVPTLLYNLAPLTQHTSLLRRAQLALKGLPARRVTPVRGLDRTASQDKFATYLPWPVARMDVTERNADPHPEPRPLQVLLVGKLGLARKNHLKLIQAIDTGGLTDKLRLTVVGSGAGDENEYYHTLRSSSSRAWITLLEARHFSMMGSLYASHDVCILPSFDEPLGAAPVEGMAYGCIPVISDQSGSAGYLTPGVDGFVFDPDRMECAAEILRRLSDGPDLLDRVKRATLETHARELSMDRFSARLAEILAQHGVT